jgi:hypothetical protein
LAAYPKEIAAEVEEAIASAIQVSLPWADAVVLSQ